MTIDWASFTPLTAVIGGIVIGVAAAGYALFTGGVAGVSGILAGALRPRTPDFTRSFAFVGGMVLSPVLFGAVTQLPGVVIAASYPALVVAGFLVGLGTRYGAGCTSGHGVCGLSRASPRSLVATAAFMAAGFVTVFVVRHVVGS